MMREAIRRFGLGELVILLAVLAVVGGTWAFVELAGEVREKATERIDDRILLAMRRADNPAVPVGPAWMHEVGRDLTAVGGVAVLTLITAFVVGFLAMRKQYGAVVLVIVATAGGLMLSSVLKYVIARDRPAVVPHLSMVYTSSFPSGHSMMSAIVYLTLGALLARFVSRWRLKLYFVGVALVLMALVGVSRVYMGVHYPTDVLAGWTAGLVWASLCWLVARYLQRRGTVEESMDF